MGNKDGNLKRILPRKRKGRQCWEAGELMDYRVKDSRKPGVTVIKKPSRDGIGRQGQVLGWIGVRMVYVRIWHSAEVMRNFLIRLRADTRKLT